MKVYSSKKELNERLLNGVNKLAENVKSTMGPRGRNVIIQPKGQTPIITKDGVTVSNFVDFEDPFENVAAQIIKQAAQKTNSQAGDGTTCTTVLCQALINEAQKHIAAGTSPIDIKRGMDKALEFLSGKLADEAKQITSQDEVSRVATISANGDASIGSLIANAVDKVGRDGSILIQDSKGLKTTLEIVDGIRFGGGLTSNSFITNARKGTVEFDDPYYLVTDLKLDSVAQMLPVLEVVAREQKPLVILADEIEGQALAVLIANSLRGSMKVTGISIPKYGEEKREFLKDLAIALGAKLVTRANPDFGLDKVKLKDLGRSKSIVANQKATTIMGCLGNPLDIKDRIETIKDQIKNTEDLNDCQRLQERISRLSGGVAVIGVGANTEVEMIEKKHRIEDALEAVRSALDEGIIPGGGAVLTRLSKLDPAEVKVDLATQKYGVQIVFKACLAPLETIIQNSGGKPDLVIQQVLDSKNNECYDAVAEKMVDAYVDGIIDPVKVIRVALESAVSAAGTFITTNYAIVEI